MLGFNKATSKFKKHVEPILRSSLLFSYIINDFNDQGRINYPEKKRVENRSNKQNNLSIKKSNSEKVNSSVHKNKWFGSQKLCIITVWFGLKQP